MNLKHSEVASLLPTTSIVFTFHDSAKSFRFEECSGEVEKERRHVTSEIRMHECIQAFTAVAVPVCQNLNAFQCPRIVLAIVALLQLLAVLVFCTASMSHCCQCPHFSPAIAG